MRPRIATASRGLLAALALMLTSTTSLPAPPAALTVLDRPLRVGAQSQPAPAPATGRPVPVNTTEQALQALQEAQPGDVITFAPGRYRFNGGQIAASRPGTEQAPIRVRADEPGSVVLELATREGFVVSAPHWQFENLTLQGACERHADCDHAFHVVADASHFVARNNLIVDFNAHFKINGVGDRFPDHGLIEGNTLTNTEIRQTEGPVVPIDLVAASYWVFRGNIISDFVKGLGGRSSYGAFVKGGGSDNRFERNLVLCEHRLRGAPGPRVGLSLGNGGTGPQYCRDKRCITEQDRGAIVSNLVAFCSNDGIDVNRAAASVVAHNTVIETTGVLVRSVESSADVFGNLVDGPIRSRNGGVLYERDNLDTSQARLALGSHPLRDAYADVTKLDFRWRGKPVRREKPTKPDEVVPFDLCGTKRPSPAAYGAVEDFSACLLKRR